MSKGKNLIVVARLIHRVFSFVNDLSSTPAHVEIASYLKQYLQLCRRLLKHDEALETDEEYEQWLQCYKVRREPSSGTQYLMKQVKGS